MKNTFIILFFTFLWSCTNSELEKPQLSDVDTSFQCNCTYEVEPFENEIVKLSGGYHLKYYFDYTERDSLCKQVVDLMKGRDKIQNINWFDYRMKKGSLGWLEFDYQNSFVFILGVSSSPNIFLIIDKTTGVEKQRGFFHGRKQEVMLYSTFEDNFSKQQLRLLDFKSNIDTQITKFENLTCKWDEEWFADCVELKDVTESKVTVLLPTIDGDVEYAQNRNK